ncbi:MaoC/PaaZ C-terminal domain-containing protein [Kribbella solani]|uniref:Hydroxyacyl-ACP dehydratase HTD2-like protein with hotdog domain n=1 Tax=Kribbella solani TaxID=236067 RepID=A0A841DXI2_9ACTN|nr:MaoC/PaaZ C-terminal domain-containing protein [Kribbella solani]MBB5979938.1 hydroxyacyl-ACP dehydratase HTD2-like protein with hotdog domain [Kribbella solani]
MTTKTTGLRFGDVSVGDRLPELRRTPSRLQLFRYSAVTWNSHRIHFDAEYAASEGYPDVLVQSHLHGAFLVSLCTDWIGPTGTLRRLEVTVRRYAVPGDVLVCTGTVTGAERADDGTGLLHLDLTETRESDQVRCAVATATVALPL